MAVHIKVAETAAELDALFRARHRVYVEQGGYMKPHPEGRIFDRFDAFSCSTNIIALLDGEVIGGVRLTEPCDVGTPADEYFDFGPHLPGGAARVGSASMLCLDHQYHHRKRVMSCLAGMFYYLAAQRGLTHLMAPANPDIEHQLLRNGYRRVAPRFHHAKGVRVSPLLLELRHLEDRLARFIRTHGRESLVYSFERAFYTPGETVVRAGELAGRAYLILDGTAVAETMLPPGQQHLARLFPGDLVGEASLLTRRPHESTVVAATELDVMVLDSETLHEQVLAAPEKAWKLLELLGDRLLDMQAAARDPAGPAPLRGARAPGQFGGNRIDYCDTPVSYR